MTSRQRDANLIRRARSFGYPPVTGNMSQALRQRLQTFVQINESNTGAPIRYTRAREDPVGNAYSGQYSFDMYTAMVMTIDRSSLRRFASAFAQYFTRIIQHVILLRGLPQNAKMQVILSDPSFAHPVSTPMLRRALVTPRFLLDMIIALLQSFEFLDPTLLRVRVRYSIPQQGGAYFETALSFNEFAKKKNACVFIKGGDCFLKCLYIGLKQLEGQFNNARRRHSRVRHLKFFEHDQVTLDDLKKYEEKYDVSIGVIQFLDMSFIYNGGSSERKLFFLFHADSTGLGHYHYVNYTHLGALWNRRKFCFKCYTAYKDVKHRCITTCLGCKTAECAGAGQELVSFTRTCNSCNLRFYNDSCFEYHLTKLCKKEKKCRECGWIYKVKKDEQHVCGHRKCGNCKQLFDIAGPTHECYHQPLEEVKDPSELYVYYDYECTLDTFHTPAGVVAMYFDDPTPIRFSTNTEFVEWVFQKKHAGYTFIAHNGGRYDFHFIKGEMVERGIKSSDVCVGNTVFYCYATKFKIRFIDSYRFIPMGLRKFPKTFGLTETVKGYFPYRFFTQERIGYEGKMPGLEWFDFHKLQEGDYAAAMQWYDNHKDDHINLYEMCMKYCESDVKLLREGCIQFRELFMGVTEQEIDPFQYITIASVCMTIYKRFHMPTNTIAVLQPYTDPRKEWSWYRSLGVSLDYVDGEMVAGGKCYIFAYCINTGCSKCYRPHTVHPHSFKFMYELAHAYRQRIDALPYEVVVMRECAWEQEDDVFVESLNMRDGFYGGRTEPVKLYRSVGPGEQIKYLDYTSLYPSVQFGVHRGITEDTYGDLKELCYPIGHPITIKKDFEELEKYFGFIKCKVTPPQDLYLPLLPEKRDGKLMFDLQPKRGTWTTVEVLKAVELGYTVDEIYEIKHFPQTSTTLFRNYVKTFLKIKQQAAGWGKIGCTTPEEKEAYIEAYRYHQDIDLDPEAIGDYNPGMYFIAKLCLNSLWGKFGQRDQFGETVDTFCRKDFDRYVHNDMYEVLNVVMHNAIARTVTVTKKKAFAAIPKNTNIAIAAFTTAYARLRLYEALEILGDKVLYMDTDSVIFVDDGTVPLVCGPYLGDLTNELDGGEHIVEFTSTGPKSYAYRTNTGGSCCKVKGFSLNVSTKDTLNFDAMKDMMLVDREKRIEVEPLKFVIGADHTIHTDKTATKVFRLTFDKRKVIERNGNEIDTMPVKK